MRIVVWGINYAPEVTGIGPYNTALCEHLRAAGHEVEMVTTFSYYPAWDKAPEDRGQLYRDDVIGGVRVQRCWHYVPRQVQRWKRIPHEASFVLTSLLRVLSQPAPDLYIVVSPPLLLGAAAWVAQKVKGAPFVFHVQDLQPDAAVGLGMLPPGRFTRMLYTLEAMAYRYAWRVSGISDGMIAAFARKGVPTEKCLLFPNGIALGEWPERGAFRRRHGFSEDDFLAVYSGNIGVKQGLDFVVEAARELAHPRVRIVICGDGADRERIAFRARDIPKVQFLPLLPANEYREMLADADVALITQVSGSGQAFFPSKLLPTLSAARPVLSVADEESELARAVRESRCGINVQPGDCTALVQALADLAGHPQRCVEHGQAGRRWVERFEIQRVLTDFTREIEKAGVRSANRAS